MDFGHPFSHQKHLAHNIHGLIIKGIDRIKMPFGNNQKMYGGLGIDVFKNRYFLVFIHKLRGQFMSDNLTKNASHEFLLDQICKQSCVSLFYRISQEIARTFD